MKVTKTTKVRITTPRGVVTELTESEARELLNQLDDALNDQRFADEVGRLIRYNMPPETTGRVEMADEQKPCKQWSIHWPTST